MQFAGLADEGIIDVVVADSTLIHSQLLSDAMKRDQCIRVVGAVSTSQDLFDLVASSEIHVAVISSNLDQEPGRGFEVTRELRQLRPGIRVIMLLESSGRETVVEAFRVGAKGIFSTCAPLKSLWKCVRCVHHGQIWADATELALALDALATAPGIRAVDSNGIKLLSKREVEVVQCVAEGLTNGEIGQRLGELGIVGFFLWLKTQILEQHDVTVFHIRNNLARDFTYGVMTKRNRMINQRVKMISYRTE